MSDPSPPNAYEAKGVRLGGSAARSWEGRCRVRRSLIAVALVLVLHAGCQAIHKDSSRRRFRSSEQRASERSLKLALLTVAVAEEGYFRDHGAYSTSLSELGFTDEARSDSITIVVATKEGWIGTGEKQGASCLLFFGIPPADYRRLIDEYEAAEGVVACK